MNQRPMPVHLQQQCARKERKYKYKYANEEKELLAGAAVDAGRETPTPMKMCTVSPESGGVDDQDDCVQFQDNVASQEDVAAAERAGSGELKKVGNRISMKVSVS